MGEKSERVKTETEEVDKVGKKINKKKELQQK